MTQGGVAVLLAGNYLVIGRNGADPIEQRRASRFYLNNDGILATDADYGALADDNDGHGSGQFGFVI